MKKGNIIVITICAVLAVAAIVVTSIFAIPKIKENRTEIPDSADTEKSSKYFDLVSRSEDVEFPYIQTDFENIFYTASLNGNINFFSFENGVFTAIPETAKFDVSVNLSNQFIPATIHYISVDGKVCGYGIFAAKNSTDKDVFCYDYIFFKLINAPDFISAQHLLLGNVYKSEFFNTDKTFSETWSVNIDSGAVMPFFSNDFRSYNMDGFYETDFAFLTQDLINHSNSNGLMFFSARRHNATYAPEGKDIFLKSGSNESFKISDAFGLYAHETDKGIVFLRKTDAGFNSVLFNNGTETVIKEFFGNFDTEYAIYGDYIYSIKDGLLYNLIDGSSKDIGVKANNISFMRLNSDNNKLVIGGNNGKSQYLGFVDLSSMTIKFFEGKNLFCSFEDPNFCFSGDYFYYLVNGSESTSIKYCIGKWSDIFA